MILDISRSMNVDLINFFNNVKIDVGTISSDIEVYIFNGKPKFIKKGEEIFPNLQSDELLILFPSLVVDMGAIPYICNGADVMAPGVVKCDMFEKGSLIVIRDENHFKAIALGKTLYNSKEILSKKNGKVALNINYVGDYMWKMLQEIL
jgi:PUA domain protein